VLQDTFPTISAASFSNGSFPYSKAMVVIDIGNFRVYYPWMIRLTTYQRKVMDYILYLHSHEEYITFTKIGRHFGMSLQAAKFCCQDLMMKGYIELKPYEVAKKGHIGRWEFILKEKSLAVDFMNKVLSEDSK